MVARLALERMERVHSLDCAWSTHHGLWDQFPFYNEARGGNWHALGFLVGAGPLLSGRSGAAMVRACRKQARDEVKG